MHTSGQILDTAEVTALSDGLGDAEAFCRFMRRYEESLPARVSRIKQAVEAQDVHAFMDAVLSLKTSSAMVGATALARAAAQMQDAAGPRAACWPACLTTLRRQLASVDRLVTLTRQAVQQVLREQTGTGPDAGHSSTVRCRPAAVHQTPARLARPACSGHRPQAGAAHR